MKYSNDPKQNFGKHRREIYARINSYKGVFNTMGKHTMLKENERDKIKKVVEAIEDLRQEYVKSFKRE